MPKITLKDVLSSIEDLAVSTQNGFTELERNLRTEIGSGFGKVNDRLTIIEGVRYHTHETRIENLEDSVRTIRTKLNPK